MISRGAASARAQVLRGGFAEAVGERAPRVFKSRGSGTRSSRMSEPRLVQCSKLGKELPGLSRPPYKNELGKRIYEEISKEAWDQWLKDSVKFINTYRVDLTSADGQRSTFKH